MAQETEVWIREFQGNLKQQDSAVNANQGGDQGADAFGSVALTVVNGEQVSAGWSVSVDGQLWGHHNGSDLVLGHISVGAHTIRVDGRVDGKDLEVVGSVTVTPTEVSSLSLELAAPPLD